MSEDAYCENRMFYGRCKKTQTLQQYSQYRTGDSEQVLDNLEIIQILSFGKIELFSQDLLGSIF